MPLHSIFPHRSCFINQQNFCAKKNRTTEGKDLLKRMFICFIYTYKMVWVFMITRFQIGYFPFEILDCTQVGIKLTRIDDLFVCTCACEYMICARARRHSRTHTTKYSLCVSRILRTTSNSTIVPQFRLRQTIGIEFHSWPWSHKYGVFFQARIQLTVWAMRVEKFYQVFPSLASILIQFQFRANNILAPSNHER